MAFALITFTTLTEFLSMLLAATSVLPLPVAVITAASSMTTSCSIRIVISPVVELNCISASLYPIKLHMRVPELRSVSMTKLPSRPVIVQLSGIPFITTVAPIISSPLEASTTFPLNTSAHKDVVCNKTAAVSKNTFFIPLIFGRKSIPTIFQPRYTAYVLTLSCRYITVTHIRRNPGRPQDGMTGIKSNINRYAVIQRRESSGTR